MSAATATATVAAIHEVIRRSPMREKQMIAKWSSYISNRSSSQMFECSISSPSSPRSPSRKSVSSPSSF